MANMKKYKFGEVCIHQTLARKCGICELEDQVEEFELHFERQGKRLDEECGARHYWQDMFQAARFVLWDNLELLSLKDIDELIADEYQRLKAEKK